MYGYIDGVNFIEEPAEKFWSWPKAYKGDSKKETKNLILSEVYCGSVKMDGHYARFIKDEDGQMRLQGRSKSVNGDYLNKIDFVPQCKSFFDSLPNGTCLIGELYFPNKRGSRNVTTILGCLKDKALSRQEKGDKLYYYVFDIWAYNNKSYLNTKIENRIKTLKEIKEKYTINDYVQYADYKIGEELWNLYGATLASGGEGIVITKLGTHPDPGKRTARKTLKCKLEIEQTIDVFLTGKYKTAIREYKGKTSLEEYSYWENIKTGEIYTVNKFKEYMSGEPIEPVSRHYALKYAGSVEIAVMKDNKIFPVGYISSITDEVRKEIVINPDKFKGMVFELSCMEIEHIDNNYSFRHAKFVGERKDKSYLDCNWSQIEQS